MKQFCRCLLLIAALGMFALRASECITVIYPDTPRPAEKNAAGELAELLGKALNVKIPCQPESAQKKGNGKVIYTGSTRFAAAKGIVSSGFRAEEYLIRNYPDGIVIAGGVPRGTLLGVYDFLFRFADIAFLDEKCTDIPKLEQLQIPENFSLRTAPAIRFRGIFTWWGADREAQFKFRSRNGENIFFQDRDMTPETAAKIGHTPVLGSPAPLNTLFYYIKEWPESGFEDCYSMDTAGKRVRPVDIFGPGQVCFSSLRAREKFAAQMLGYIAADRKKSPDNYPLLYNLSVNDINHVCNCPECKKALKKYGSHSGNMLDFVNFVARKVAPVYPDVLIQTSSYLAYEAAPKHGIKAEKNVIVRTSPSRWGSGFDTMRPITLPRNKKTLDALKSWADIAGIQIWNYWILFGSTPDKNACIVNINAIAANIRAYRDMGANYIFSECEDPQGTTFHAMRVWVGYQLKKNPDADVNALVNRFMRGYYGAAAPQMRKYYDYLESRQQEAPELDCYGVLQRQYTDEKFFRTVEPLMQQALQAVKNDPVRTGNVQKELVPFDIARIIAAPEINGLPDAGTIRKRLRPLWTKFVNEYHTGITKKRSLAAIEEFFALYQDKKPGAKYPLPAKLQGRELYEFTFPDFHEFKNLTFFGVRQFDDPDAAGGKAMGFDKSIRVADPDKFHAGALNGGIRDRVNKRTIHSFNIPKDYIPADEKFHFYPLGTFQLAPYSLFYFHETWSLQQHLGFLYRKNDPGDNRYELYVSLKFTGPAYVKNSKRENAIIMDRILLVKALK